MPGVDTSKLQWAGNAAQMSYDKDADEFQLAEKTGTPWYIDRVGNGWVINNEAGNAPKGPYGSYSEAEAAATEWHRKAVSETPLIREVANGKWYLDGFEYDGERIGDREFSTKEAAVAWVRTNAPTIRPRFQSKSKAAANPFSPSMTNEAVAVMPHADKKCPICNGMLMYVGPDSPKLFCPSCDWIGAPDNKPVKDSLKKSIDDFATETKEMVGSANIYEIRPNEWVVYDVSNSKERGRFASKPAALHAAESMGYSRPKSVDKDDSSSLFQGTPRLRPMRNPKPGNYGDYSAMHGYDDALIHHPLENRYRDVLHHDQFARTAGRPTYLDTLTSTLANQPHMADKWREAQSQVRDTVPRDQRTRDALRHWMESSNTKDQQHLDAILSSMHSQNLGTLSVGEVADLFHRGLLKNADGEHANEKDFGEEEKDGQSPATGMADGLTALRRAGVSSISDLTPAKGELASQYVHDLWMFREGRRTGGVRETRQHLMVPYSQLPESEKEKDREYVRLASRHLGNKNIAGETTDSQHAAGWPQEVDGIDRSVSKGPSYALGSANATLAQLGRENPHLQQAAEQARAILRQVVNDKDGTRAQDAIELLMPLFKFVDSSASRQSLKTVIQDLMAVRDGMSSPARARPMAASMKAVSIDSVKPVTRQTAPNFADKPKLPGYGKFIIDARSRIVRTVENVLPDGRVIGDGGGVHASVDGMLYDSLQEANQARKDMESKSISKAAWGGLDWYSFLGAVIGEAKKAGVDSSTIQGAYSNPDLKAAWQEGKSPAQAVQHLTGQKSKSAWGGLDWYSWLGAFIGAAKKQGVSDDAIKGAYSNAALKQAWEAGKPPSEAVGLLTQKSIDKKMTWIGWATLVGGAALGAVGLSQHAVPYEVMAGMFGVSVMDTLAHMFESNATPQQGAQYVASHVPKPTLQAAAGKSVKAVDKGLKEWAIRLGKLLAGTGLIALDLGTTAVLWNEGLGIADMFRDRSIGQIGANLFAEGWSPEKAAEEIKQEAHKSFEKSLLPGLPITDGVNAFVVKKSLAGGRVKVIDAHNQNKVIDVEGLSIDKDRYVVEDWGGSASVKAGDAIRKSCKVGPALKFNDAERSVTYMMSSATMDGDGDVVEPAGMTVNGDYPEVEVA